jgi:hypothetical protein
MSRGLQLCIACVVAVAILPATTRAQDARHVKPIATAKGDSRDGRLGPFEIKRNGVVVRNAEELVALSSKAKSATDSAVQKEMEVELARLLKVETIDWKKQMVLAVISERFESLTTDGKVLTATYPPYKDPLALAVPPTPKVLVLIERFDGEVKFVQKVQKKE